MEIQLSLRSHDRIAVSLDYKRKEPLIKRWDVSRSVIDAIYADVLDLVERSLYVENLEVASPQAETREKLKALGLALFEATFLAAADEFRETIRQPHGPESVTFEIDRELAYLPIEILFDGETFLALRLSLGRRIFAEGIRSVASGARTCSVLIVGDPSDDPLIRSDIENEIDGIRDIFRKSKVAMKIATGSKVDEGYFLTHLPSKTIFHFTGHGALSEDFATSGIMLADGILSEKSLSGLQHPPVITFLNMCTASWHEAWKSSVGLVETFLRRGTRCCIATLWDVRSSSAATLASSFYGNLLDGKTVGEALRQARLDVVEKFGLNDMSWAAYTLYGDPNVTLESLLRESPRKSPSYVVGLVATAIFVGSLLLPSSISREPTYQARTEFGYIVASSNPKGATVIVDGNPMAVTPSAIEVPEGSHKVAIVKEGFRRWEAWVEVTPSQRTVIEATLEGIQ